MEKRLFSFSCHLPLRAILVAIICVFLAFSSSLLSATPNVVPAPSIKAKAIEIPKEKTSKDYYKMRYAWMLRHTVEAYSARGSRNAKWDAKAVAFLEGTARFTCVQSNRPSRNDLEKMAKELLSTGCNDQMVRVWCALVMHFNGNQKEAVPLLIDALTKLESVDTYPVARMVGTGYLAVEAKSSDDVPYAVYTEWWRKFAPRFFEVVETDAFRGEEVRIAWDYAQVRFKNIMAIYLANQIKQAARSKRMDPWLRQMVIGSLEIVRAWEMRGGDYAGAVTEQGWKGFADHMTKAHTALQAAYALHPEYPESATEMITVSMGGYAGKGETDELWLQRALEAQIDWPSAHTKYLWAKMPRWNGSHEQMLAHAFACVSKGRYDTFLPYIIFDAIKNIKMDLSGDQWRLLFRIPEIKTQMDRIFAGLDKAETDTARRNTIAALHAVVLFYEGRYEEAKVLADKVDFEMIRADCVVHPRSSFYSMVGLHGGGWKAIVTGLDLFTGPLKATLTQAESLSVAGKTKSAITLFDKALSQCADPDQKFYLLRRVVALQVTLIPDMQSVYTPFHTAAKNHATEIVEYALDRGLDANYHGGCAMSMFYISIYYGADDVVRLLLKKGVDVNQIGPVGESVLSLATRKNQMEILQMLVAAKADVNRADRRGQTALFHAINMRSLELVQFLLKNGANPNQKDSKGVTPLYLSVESCDAEITEALLKSGADPNMVSGEGNIPLLHCARNGKTPKVKLLLEHGANPDCRAEDNASPLRLAVYKKHADVIKMLLAKDVDVNAVATDERTSVLHVAARQGILVTVNLLLDKGADSNVKNKAGFFPIHDAIRTKHRTASLAIAGVMKDVNMKVGDYENTALHMAAGKYDFPELITLLIEKGADVNIKNKEGLTALELAQRAKLLKNVAALQ